VAPPQTNARVRLACAPLAKSAPAGVGSMSSNGGKRVRKPSPYVASKGAALGRLARQVARDQQARTPPSISLPRLSCLEDCAPPDVDANASRTH